MQRVPTPGSEQLKKYFDSPGCPHSQADVARLLDISPQAVSNHAAAVDRPSPLHREIYYRVAGVPVSAWLTEDERREVAEIEARARGAL